MLQLRYKLDKEPLNDHLQSNLPKQNLFQGQKLTGAQLPMAPRFWSGLLNFYL
jgi:hypothetical protein